MKNIHWISNWLKISVLAAFGVMFGARSVWAQDSSGIKFLIGPIAVYGTVAYNTSEFPALASKPGWYIEENGSSPSHFFGISSEIPLSSSMHDFLVLEAIYDSKSANFTSFGSVQSLQRDSSVNLSSPLNYVDINVGFKYNMTSNGQPSMFGIQACASFGWAINHSFITHIDSIVYTNSYPFFYSAKSQSTASNIDGLNQIRIAIRTELTYDIPFANRWILTPSVGYDVPLTKVDNTDRNWWASSGYGAIALRYAIGSF